MDSQIIRFLRNEASDFKGRRLIELVWRTDNQIERTHQIIYWMFPTDIPSTNYVNAPVLTEADIKVMKTDTIVREAIRTCLSRMIEFYEANDYWITQKNHNFKRITRILRCLWLAGLKHDYVCFQKALDQIYQDYSDIIGDETYLYWKSANNDEFMKNPPKFKPAVVGVDDENEYNLPAWFRYM